MHLRTKIELSACFGVCYSLNICHNFAFPDFSGLEKNLAGSQTEIYAEITYIAIPVQGKKPQHLK